MEILPLKNSMICVTVRALYYKMVGIPAAPMDEEEETTLMTKVGFWKSGNFSSKSDQFRIKDDGFCITKTWILCHN